MSKCVIGNHQIAQLFNSCLNKVNFNKINEMKELLNRYNFLEMAQNEVNNMEICDIETSLYYFRFKRNGNRFENVDSWFNRIMKGRELNNNIKIYISMLLEKYYSSNIKCADV